MAIKPNTAVRQKVEPIRGTIAKTVFNESTQQLEYLVQSSDGTQSRWFAEDQIEADPDAKPAAAPKATKGE